MLPYHRGDVEDILRTIPVPRNLLEEGPELFGNNIFESAYPYEICRGVELPLIGLAEDVIQADFDLDDLREARPLREVLIIPVARKLKAHLDVISRPCLRDYVDSGGCSGTGL